MIAADDIEGLIGRYRLLRALTSPLQAWHHLCLELDDPTRDAIGLALGDQVAASTTLVEVHARLDELCSFARAAISVREQEKTGHLTAITSYVDFPEGVTDYVNKKIAQDVHDLDFRSTRHRSGVHVPVFGSTFKEGWQPFCSKIAMPGWFTAISRTTEGEAMPPAGILKLLHRPTYGTTLSVRVGNKTIAAEPAYLWSWDEQEVLVSTGPLDLGGHSLVRVPRNDPHVTW